MIKYTYSVKGWFTTHSVANFSRVTSKKLFLIHFRFRFFGPNEELFELKSEAFQPKALTSFLSRNACGRSGIHSSDQEDLVHREDARKTESDSFGEGDSGEAELNAFPSNVKRHDRRDSSNVLAVTMTLSVNSSSLPPTLPLDYTPELLKAFQHLAARKGDVATPVTAILVLGQRLDVKSLLPGLLEHWVMQYIDQMQRLQLFNRVAIILNHPTMASKLPQIHDINQYNTSVVPLCPHCHTRFVTAAKSFVCRKCGGVVGKCGWCNEVVKGLYVWCQGCGHGGHLHHLYNWYEGHSRTAHQSSLDSKLLCPTGCGHVCQYM